ncbi:hypothetical protein [Pandoraea apista]|uniref:hypothetical protein n=1 Tax=Pandoraea apista TaxID=93218 RepID=UPI00065A0106|nr:hypothetical protein [Pandoraea apista]ALS64918.1 hypothetical protein AT395_07910 [Pandoraea apista]CFB65289.1 hypothetical protein LMG16407_04787 [Pandoraea apista]
MWTKHEHDGFEIWVMPNPEFSPPPPPPEQVKWGYVAHICRLGMSDARDSVATRRNFADAACQFGTPEAAIAGGFERGIEIIEGRDRDVDVIGL